MQFCGSEYLRCWYHQTLQHFTQWELWGWAEMRFGWTQCTWRKSREDSSVVQCSVFHRVPVLSHIILSCCVFLKHSISIALSQSTTEVLPHCHSFVYYCILIKFFISLLLNLIFCFLIITWDLSGEGCMKFRRAIKQHCVRDLSSQSGVHHQDRQEAVWERGTQVGTFWWISQWQPLIPVLKPQYEGLSYCGAVHQQYSTEPQSLSQHKEPTVPHVGFVVTSQ